MERVRLRDTFLYSLLLNKINENIKKWDYSEISGFGCYQTYTGHYAHVGIKISKNNDQYPLHELISNIDENQLPLAYLNEIIRNLNFFISYTTAIKGERAGLKFEIIDGSHHVVDSRVTDFHIATIYALVNCFDKTIKPITERENIEIERCKKDALQRNNNI